MEPKAGGTRVGHLIREAEGGGEEREGRGRGGERGGGERRGEREGRGRGGGGERGREEREREGREEREGGERGEGEREERDGYITQHQPANLLHLRTHLGAVPLQVPSALQILRIGPPVASNPRSHRYTAVTPTTKGGCAVIVTDPFLGSSSCGHVISEEGTAEGNTL